jgi:hypothetical protein
MNRTLKRKNSNNSALNQLEGITVRLRNVLCVLPLSRDEGWQIVRSAGGRGQAGQPRLRAPRAELKLRPASPVDGTTERWRRERTGSSMRGQKRTGQGVSSEERRGPEGELGALYIGPEESV